MTPIEALQLLATMADRGMGNGADHRAVAEAVEVLRLLVEPLAEPQPPDDPPGPNRATRRAQPKK